jgi:hypothetical protein
MQTKDILMFATVAMLIGTIVSMTTAGMVAAQTVNSSNNGNNINTNNCQEINPAGLDGDGATPSASESEGELEDADEPGDVDVNDEEDTDTGSEDVGEGMTQLESQVRQHIEGACMSLQNNDIQGVLMHLDLALDMLRGNTTTV